MAFLFPLSHSSSFAFALLLLICCCCYCQSDTISLHDVVCVKKNVPLCGGIFTPVGDARIEIDPSFFPIGAGNATIDVLLMNPKDEQLVISVVLFKGTKSCFTDYVHMPDECSFGEPTGDECDNNSDDNDCPVHLDFICNLAMISVDDLPNARFVRVSLWKNYSVDNMDRCAWVAHIDNAYILSTKSESASDVGDDGQCWKNHDSRRKETIIAAIISCALVIVVAVMATTLVIYLLHRRSKQKKRAAARRRKQKSQQNAFAPVDVGLSSSTIAGDKGVEVPASLLSDGSDEDTDDEKT